MDKAAQIEQLKKDIDYEQKSYDNYAEYPTHTDQYYRALEKQRQKISSMKEKLRELEK